MKIDKSLDDGVQIVRARWPSIWEALLDGIGFGAFAGCVSALVIGWWQASISCGILLIALALGDIAKAIRSHGKI